MRIVVQNNAVITSRNSDLTIFRQVIVNAHTDICQGPLITTKEIFLQDLKKKQKQMLQIF